MMTAVCQSKLLAYNFLVSVCIILQIFSQQITFYAAGSIIITPNILRFNVYKAVSLMFEKAQHSSFTENRCNTYYYFDLATGWFLKHTNQKILTSIMFLFFLQSKLIMSYLHLKVQNKYIVYLYRDLANNVDRNIYNIIMAY